MNASPAGLAMLKRLEACNLKAYQDGGGVWTIGYGHTGHDVFEGLEITEFEAERLFKNDVRRAERAVSVGILGVPVSQSQFDALVSLVFNVGTAAFYESRMALKLRSRDFFGAANEFDDWVHDNGKVVAGLVKRRAREKSLFLAGTRHEAPA